MTISRMIDYHISTNENNWFNFYFLMMNYFQCNCNKKQIEIGDQDFFSLPVKFKKHSNFPAPAITAPFVGLTLLFRAYDKTDSSNICIELRQGLPCRGSVKLP